MQSSNSKNDPTYSKQVIEMFTVANEYCLFFKKAEEYSFEDIIDYFHKISPLLYLKGSLIPVIKVNDPSYKERFLTEEQYEALFLILKKKFKEKDTFYILDENYEAKEASLAECICDIFQDMSDFVLLYSKDNSFSKENAIFQIKELFEIRWGNRILEALKAVYNILYNSNNQQKAFTSLD